MSASSSTCIRPYGDTLNDGAVQLSFTLPMDATPECKEAARQLALKMGLREPNITHVSSIGPGFTFFVIYGRCSHSVDLRSISVPKIDAEIMSFDQVNEFIEKHLGRKIVVVGACTGTDAHTVGIDAVFNMKGFAGEYGLERYPWFEAYNLGSQVPNGQLLRFAREKRADAILVSQVVTQKNVHIKNLTELIELAEAEGLRDRLIMVCGGPRLNNELAAELGYDAGFGPGTRPNEVASFLAYETVRRNSGPGGGP